MVKWLFLILPLALFAEDVKVIVSVDAELATEFAELQGTIAIHHPQGWDVDLDSFRLGSDPLPVTFLHDATQSSLSIINGVRSEKRSVISTFFAKFPGQAAGRHSLPSISLKVGGRLFKSDATSYFVYGSESSPDFRLSAHAEPEVIYPGEHARLIYRLAYRFPMDTTGTELPFLEPKGLKKVGSKSVRTDYDGGMTIQEISQEVEALRPGEYRFGEASIEGIPYQKDFFGRPLLERRKLRAEAPPVTLSVLSLPLDGQPASFDGAIGNFKLKSELLNSSNPRVGDRLRMRVTVSGKGSLATVSLQDLSKKAGFSGFRFSDMPPIIQEESGEKIYNFELRPLSDKVKEIPSIEMGYFDTKLKRYGVTKTTPIALQVASVEEISEPIKREEKLEIPTIMPIETKADDCYRAAELAQSSEEMENGFNEALSLYLEALKRENSVPLLFNIGNSYFQLGEPARALYYYEQARTLSPRNGKICSQCELARSHLSISSGGEWHLFSSKEWHFILAGLLTLAITIASISIKYRKLFKWALLPFCISLCIAYNSYVTDPKALVIKSALLRRDAGDQYASILDRPISPGHMVMVRGYSADGDWAEVSMRGAVGYIPSDSLAIF